MSANTGFMDDDHILTVLCKKCGEPLVSFVAVCSLGNSQPALYVEPCVPLGTLNRHYTLNHVNTVLYNHREGRRR